MKQSLRATLPWPPSINHYYGVAQRGRRYLKPAGRQFRQDVKCIMLAVRPLTDPVSMKIIAYRPDRRVRDLDNLLKAILDSVSGYFYVDDRQVHELNIKWGDRIIKGGAVDVVVTEIGEVLDAH